VKDLREENDNLNMQIQLGDAVGGPSLFDELGGEVPAPPVPQAESEDGTKLGKASAVGDKKVLRLRLSAKWLVALDRKEEATLIRQLILQLKKLTFLEVYIR
jgi:hypothetical protein